MLQLINSLARLYNDMTMKHARYFVRVSHNVWCLVLSLFTIICILHIAFNALNRNMLITTKTRMIKRETIDVDSFRINSDLLENVCNPSPYLVVLILSTFGAKEERNSIRNTWLNSVWTNLHPNFTVKHIFILGLKNRNEELAILHESKMFKDILSSNFIDSYENLTLKVLIGLNWINKNCEHTKYVLKADDDTLILVPNLLLFLSQNVHIERIIGHVVESGVVNRKGRWKVALDLYPHKIYPPYVFGNSYVIPRSLLQSLITASNHMPSIPIEDAYITGILRREAKSNLLHHPGFSFWLQSTKVTSLCLYSYKISITNLGPFKMLKIWNTFLHFNYTNCQY